MQANSNRQQEAIKCLLVINGGECKQGQGIVALQPWFNIHWYGEEKKKGLHAIQLYHTSFFFLSIQHCLHTTKWKIWNNLSTNGITVEKSTCYDFHNRLWDEKKNVSHHLVQYNFFHLFIKFIWMGEQLLPQIWESVTKCF